MRIVNVGVDFGSTGLRIAYAAPGQPVQLASWSEPQPSWLGCEPVRSGRLGVAFPSLKSRLGPAGAGGPAGAAASGGAEPSPFELVSRALTAVRTRIEREADGKVGRTVLTVPVRYPSDQRAALRDAAQQAGLGEVQLIGDSAAAVIGHAAPSGGSGTFLVYSLGYDGCELGLVRVAGGHYRVLGYDGVGGLGGASIDHHILLLWLQTLRYHGLVSGALPLDPLTWLQLREAAQKTKEELGRRAKVSFPRSFTDRSGFEWDVVFKRDWFEPYLERVLAGSLDRAGDLLTQSGLVPADLDTVLLVGGTARLPKVAALLAQRFGREPVLVPPDQLARGAARHAGQLRIGEPTPIGTEDRAPAIDASTSSGWEEGSELPTIVASPPAPDGTKARLVLPDGAGTAGPPAGTGLDEARRLAAAGQRDKAIALLKSVIDEARGLLEQLREGTPEPPRVDPRLADAKRSVAVARGLLEEGKYEEAVQAAHIAWQIAPGSPDVFDEMIDVHCRAAMTKPELDRFADEERWLTCAYGHDQSNARVRDLLAERNLLHAQQLGRLGRRDEALAAVNQSLVWDPERRAALELRQNLLRRRARARATEPEPRPEG
jgi:hypothetical protein